MSTLQHTRVPRSYSFQSIFDPRPIFGAQTIRQSSNLAIHSSTHIIYKCSKVISLNLFIYIKKKHLSFSWNRYLLTCTSGIYSHLLLKFHYITPPKSSSKALPSYQLQIVYWPTSNSILSPYYYYFFHFHFRFHFRCPSHLHFLCHFLW